MNASNLLIASASTVSPDARPSAGSVQPKMADALTCNSTHLMPDVCVANEGEPLRDIGGNFSLSHLSAFMAVLECGRVSAAGERLRRSHSAISRSIAVLESRFGCTLLTRAPAGVTPTTKGLACNARCQIIRQELSDLRDLLVHSGHDELCSRNPSLFRMHVDVSRLRAVAAVHDFRSVRNAAHFLAVSQPAVSSSIASLEKDLDIALFARTPSGTIPTPAGVSIAVAFKRILSELRKIEDDTASADGVSSGTVSIGGLAYSRNALLPSTIKQVLAGFPQIVVRTVEGPIESLLAGMHAGEIDFLICARPNPALLEGIAVESLVQDPMKLFVSCNHPLASRRNLSAVDVIEYPFILPPVSTVTRRLLDAAFRSAVGRVPKGSVETSSRVIIRNLLIGTFHICFRSVLEFSHDLREEQIVALDLDFDLPKREICILQRKGAVATSAVSDVIKTLRQVAATYA